MPKRGSLKTHGRQGSRVPSAGLREVPQDRWRARRALTSGPSAQSTSVLSTSMARASSGRSGTASLASPPIPAAPPPPQRTRGIKARAAAAPMMATPVAARSAAAAPGAAANARIQPRCTSTGCPRGCPPSARCSSKPRRCNGLLSPNTSSAMPAAAEATPWAICSQTSPGPFVTIWHNAPPHFVTSSMTCFWIESALPEFVWTTPWTFGPTTHF
mmetsp:Transcript_23165/g.34747  ORF Transcript_23165/g.34747 Transcript_23165/m.34747 type:complete len:215 (-) Transcript_23165:482-1126(-)